MIPSTLQTIAVSSIDFGTRYREDYGDISELIESIKQQGLINPIAVCTHPNPDSEFHFLLCAGGRRLTAHKNAEWDDIDAKIFEKPLNEIELRSLELEENLRRKDLTWQEKVSLRKKIHELQIAIHGPKISKAPDAPGHSVRDTAALLGVSHTSVAKDLRLAETVERFKGVDWSKCKNQADAEKLVRKIEKTVVKEELAKRAEKAFQGNNDLKIRKLADAYVVGDFFAVAKQIPDSLYQFVEIDPPYGIDLTKVKRDYINDGYNEVSAKDYPAFMRKVFATCHRVMAANSWGVCWFGPDPWYSNIKNWLAEAGFKVGPLPGIWTKPTGQTNQPNTRLANAYEMFFYFSKGQPSLSKPGRINVFNQQPVPHQYKIHPTERPIELIRDILTTFTMPNSHVLVPFAGSGATLLAAAKESMTPLGTDLTASYRDGYILNLKKEFGDGKAE
jgi:site-specific DNA-methyltransferase (adenine-specific)